MTRAKLILAVVLLTLLDLGTKWQISANFRIGQSLKLIPGFFNLTLVHNTGAAFGLGNRWPMWGFVIISLVAIGLVGFLLTKMDPSEKLSRAGMVLITSGAIGNLVDRIRFGYVVDFLDVYIGKHHWPAFNVADSYITIGACLFALDLFLHPKKPTV